MIGKLKMIGLLILKIVGKVVIFLSVLYCFDFVVKSIVIISLKVIFEFDKIKKLFKNCCVIMWVLLFNVKWFVVNKDLLVFKLDSNKVVIILFIIDWLWILNYYKNEIKKVILIVL